MLEISKRAATEEEKSGLRKVTQGPSRDATMVGAVIVTALFAVGGLLLGVLFASLVYFASRVFPEIGPVNGNRAMRLGLLAGALIGSSYFSWQARKRQRDRDGAARRDLGEGQVDVLRVTASGYARCEAYEGGDDWPACFVEIGPRKLLYLQGPYMRQALKDEAFPSTEFEIIRWPHSNLTVSARTLSKTKAPSRPLANDEITDEECYVPEDTEVIEATWEEVPAELRRRQGRPKV